MREVGPGSRQGRAIAVTGCVGLRIWEVGFEGYAADCIRLSHAWDFTIGHCHFDGLSTRLVSQYGISVGPYCRSGLVTGIRSRSGGKHLFTTWGDGGDRVPCAHVLVVDGIATDGGTNVFDTHHNARGIVFKNCVVHNTPGAAFQIRGSRCAVLDPIVSGARCGVKVAFGGDDNLIRGGRLSDCDTGIFVVSSDHVRVRGVLIDNPRTSGVKIERQTGYPSVAALDMDDVEVSGDPAGAAFDFNARLDQSAWRIRDCRAPDARTTMTGRSPAEIRLASAITIPHTANVFLLRGSTPVTSIAADQTQMGRRVTLVATGPGQRIAPGNRVKLYREWTSGQAGDTLTLVCVNGEIWCEQGGS